MPFSIPLPVAAPPLVLLPKAATGILGLDEILGGGVPVGRPTMVIGGAGCGKTLLAIEFLCHGATHGEPGVLISFEEDLGELASNTASLGLDLPKLQADGLLAIDYVPFDSREIAETGEYDLEALFLRIDAAVSAVGAQRIAIDAVETLFGALHDPAIVRAELKRLFGWLKERRLTAVITAERGEGTSLTRFGIEEYVSDCVMVLDHRITEERSTRRVRVLKYRGSQHSSDEYPFLITGRGIAVLPITSTGLEQPASTERISTGIDRLDAALSGGIYRDSSVLISGTAGTCKTTLAAQIADAACRRGERTLFISYEESSSQIIRDMKSAGIHLAPWVESGLLRFEAVRPTLFGVESHLAALQHTLSVFDPSVVIVDPLTSLMRTGTRSQVASMLIRFIDLLKSSGVTAIFTALKPAQVFQDADLDVSSLVDTWLLAETLVHNGERNRALSIIKSRGMAHSNQVIEVQISSAGIELLEPYVGSSGVLTGSARLIQESADRHEEAKAAEELDLRER